MSVDTRYIFLDHMVLVNYVQKQRNVMTVGAIGKIIEMNLDPGDPRMHYEKIRIDAVETDTSHYSMNTRGQWIEEWYYGRYAR